VEEAHDPEAIAAFDAVADYVVTPVPVSYAAFVDELFHAATDRARTSRQSTLRSTSSTLGDASPRSEIPAASTICPRGRGPSSRPTRCTSSFRTSAARWRPLR
jgi:hypothetical protein